MSKYKFGTRSIVCLIRGRLFSTRKLFGCSTERTPIGTGAVGGDRTGLSATAGALQLVEEIHCLECPCNGLPCVCVKRECEIENIEG